MIAHDRRTGGVPLQSRFQWWLGSAREEESVLAANWFENKDGLLIIPNGEKDWHLIQLLYTDEEAKAKTFLTQVDDRAQQRWSDVRTCFTWATTAKQKRSQSHSEIGSEDEKKDMATEETMPTATSTSLKNQKGSGASSLQQTADDNANSYSDIIRAREGLWGQSG